MALSINDSMNHVIGIELSVNGMKLGLYDLALNNKREINVSSDHSNLESLKENIENLRLFSGSNKILGIAISVEGIVDELSGLVIKAKDTGFDRVNLKAELAYFDIPVQIRNDVNMLAETDSERHNNRNYMLVKIDRGIGAAFVLNGKIHRSDNNAAGEFGHTSVFTLGNKRLCRCGKKGCLTTETSMTALESKLGLNIGQMASMVEKNEPEIMEVVEETAEYISQPLSNIVTVLDLNKIILTGSVVTTFGDYFEKKLHEKLFEKLNAWGSFNEVETLGQYNMSDRSARCAVESYFTVSNFDIEE